MTTGVLLNNRYQLESEIGRGGMGIVYQAYDLLLQRPVAVKVLWASDLGSQGRARLLREAQAAARLNHPNIISIYDAGDEGGMSYIVMELLDGDSLYEHKPSTVEEIVEVFGQVCDALQHAHAHGIIHRDLKPENVILTSKGIAKLTDFGLSRSIRARVSIEGAIVGTVYYLAPEQALKQDVDVRADLYALGVMMYEMAAGRLPFTADDPLGVISQHLHATVVPPSTYNGGIPPALEALIVRLLNKRPEDRPASAAEVRESLLRLLESPDLLDESSVCDTPLERLARGRLVGRQSEYDEIKELWRAVNAQNASQNVLVISGESGVGKTPLVKELRALAEIYGARIVQGDCYARSSAPYAPIRAALGEIQPLPDNLPAVALADVLSLSSELSARYAEQYTFVPSNPPLKPQAEQQRLMESIFLLFAQLTEHQPCLLVIEDAHWADSASLSLLHHLVRRSRSANLKLLLAITYRRSELTDNPELRSLIYDLHEEHLMHVIDLEPFTREQTRELLVTMFMEDISEHFLDSIYNVTEGNLFFIEEICKALIEEGRLSCEGGGWKFSGLERLELPQSVRLALQGRVARLPERTQEILRHAAVIGREFDFDILLASSEFNEDTLIDALEAAERSQLINEARQKGGGSTPGRETFAFAHGLIAATLREDIGSLRRHRIHRRVAAALERLHPDDLEELAYHYTQAGDREKARQYHIKAGDRARKYFAHAQAIEFYNEALRLTPEEPVERFHILAAREQVFDMLAKRNQQRADIDEMLDLAEAANDDSLHLDAVLALAQYYLDTDHLQSREPAQHAVELARRLGDPVREARALRAVGWSGYFRGDYHESLTALETAVIRFRQAGLLADAAESLHMLSLVTGLQGLGEMAISQKYAEDAVRLSRQAGDRRQEAIGLRRVAINFLDQMKYDEAYQIAMQSLDLHHALGDLAEETSALNVIGVALGWLGRGEEARDYLTRSLALAVQTGSVHGISVAFENLQWIYYRREGEFEAGLAMIDEKLNEPDIAGSPYLRNILESRKADILTILGQYEPALEILHRIRNDSGLRPGPAEQARLHLHIAILYAEMGDFRRAWSAFDEVRELSKRFQRSAEAAGVLKEQAYLAWMENDPARFEAAVAQVEQAILLLRGTGWVYDLADALHVAARLALAQGKPELALERSAEAVRLSASLPVMAEMIIFTHSRALRACGRENEANQHLERVYQRVVMVASKLTNPAYRQTWIERALDNPDVIQDWKAYQKR